ncbi:MAG: hypothetical protein JO023_14180 [Chloroflexi bacterium]|nr:hypothetical protein [Chloroflexota bacterium]
MAKVAALYGLDPADALNLSEEQVNFLMERAEGILRDAIKNPAVRNAIEPELRSTLQSVQRAKP